MVNLKMGNSLSMNLTNKCVILTDDYIYINSETEETIKGDPEKRVFLCEGGYGCSKQTMGSLISGILIHLNYKMAIKGIGGYIERLATDEEIEEAKKIGEAVGYSE